MGTPPVYVEDHEQFSEIEAYLADAVGDFRTGDLEAALAAIECARSICTAHNKPAQEK